MDQDIQRRLDEQAKRLEEIYASVEKTRKYFLTSLIVTVVFFVLPLVGLVIAIPKFLGTYSATMQGLEAL